MGNEATQTAVENHVEDNEENKEEHIHPINIHIDGKPYRAPKPQMTGAEIKVLGGIPANYQLFLEVPGPGEDEGIRDDQIVHMRSGQRFYSVPAGTLGAVYEA